MARPTFCKLKYLAVIESFGFLKFPGDTDERSFKKYRRRNETKKR